MAFSTGPILNKREELKDVAREVISNGGTFSGNLNCYKQTMDSNYDESTLLLFPNNTNTGEIYCTKPLGVKLTFARNSNATRVGPDGLIEKVRTNLLLQSETFSNASWIKNNSTFSIDTLTAGAGTTVKGIQQNQTTNGLQNVYFDVEYVSHQWLQILFGTSSSDLGFANFDIQNKVVGTMSGGFVGQIQDFGTYVRISLSINSVNKLSVLLFFVDSGSASRASSTSSTGAFKLFRSQLQTGDIATDYIPTTTAAVSVGITADIPRLDYTGGGCPSLLLEPQRTNLVTYSEQLNTGSGGTSVVTANTQVSPDGYTNGDTIGAGYWTKSTSQAAGTYTLSVFAKYQSNASFLFYIYDGAYYQGLFNLQTGVATTSTGSPSVSMVNYGNGWYRCILTATTASTISEVGFGSGNIYAYGLQLEAGAYATSYIPTLATSVTRVADAASKTGISSLLPSTEGTLFIDADINFDNSNFTILGSTYVNGGTMFTNSVYFYIINNKIDGQIWNAPVFVGWTGLSPSLANGRHKLAISWKSNDFAYYINGNLIASSTAYSEVPTGMNRLDVGDYYGSYTTNNKYNQLLIFKTRLTNDQLAELTA